MHQPAFDNSTAEWSEPELVDTTHGLWPAAGLERSVGVNDDENETTHWVEYHLGGKIVHRSVAMQLKKWPAGCEAAAAIFG